MGWSASIVLVSSMGAELPNASDHIAQIAACYLFNPAIESLFTHREETMSGSLHLSPHGTNCSLLLPQHLTERASLK